MTSRDDRYNFNRAIALLAHAYANTAQPEKAEALFRLATDRSTLSETYLNYAAFLASQNRNAEARDWAQRVLARKSTIPRYLQRASGRGSARPPRSSSASGCHKAGESSARGSAQGFQT